MRGLNCFRLLGVALVLAGCKPQPVLDPQPTPTPEPIVAPVATGPTVILAPETPTPTPTATPTPPEVEAAKPTIVLPPPPELSGAGYQLILDFEVGGGKGYYDRYLSRPTYPGAASGVTIAVGYDLGYNSKAVILSDWSALPARNRLANVAGITGTKAKSRVAEVRDILIEWKLAEKVFNDVTVSKFYSQAKRAFPGMERLHPNAQAALVSLVFNRGPGMSGPNRVEMRNIQPLVPKRDYDGMAFELRSMPRIWRGTPVEAGLTRRRYAEAKLMLTP